MISIILYGRNDSYGYNLHKRAALSLNCMAELLEAPDDEIIFVDYNTPDDFPTFPEAIEDTLTERAKRCLRILRVRHSVHQRFTDRTHLLALEPIARNVAVRRSNPNNRWILSTNTDIILVPRGSGGSLTSIVADLPRGYWGLPRFEIPETLWESLDRRDAMRAIAAIGQWGWNYHLNEVVRGVNFIAFDGPGDFQLLDREDLFRVHGFHEEMLLGWHVDSNIAKRMWLLYGGVGELTEQLFCYHCDHTRQVTSAHKHDAVENDSHALVFAVDRPEVPAQAETWGCADDPIEEVRLAQTAAVGYVATLDQAIQTPQTGLPEVAFVSETYGTTGYAPEHVLPFLVDLFASAPRHWSIMWSGCHQHMYDLFRQSWRLMGFTGKMVIPESPIALVQPGDGASIVPLDEALSAADAFIFDFAQQDGSPFSLALSDDEEELLAVLEDLFRDVAVAESDPRTRPRIPRRLIGINAVHNRSEGVFADRVAAARTPFNTRVRHGFAFPAALADPLDWVARLRPGSAGEVVNGAVRSRPLETGIVARSPKLRLGPGRYELDIGIEAKPGPAARITVPLPVKHRLQARYHRLSPPAQAVVRGLVSMTPGLRASLAVRQALRVTFEVALGSRVLASLSLQNRTFGTGSYRIPFEIAPSVFVVDPLAQIDVRILSTGFADFTLTRLVVRPLSTPSRPSEAGNVGSGTITNRAA